MACEAVLTQSRGPAARGPEDRHGRQAPSRHKPRRPVSATLAGLVLLWPLLGGLPGGAAAEAPAQAQGAGIATEALADYVIGPADLLRIEVFELPELSRIVRVGGDGRISYPLVGSVTVGGLTKRDLELRLTQLLEERFVRNPQVTVFLEAMESQKVSVLGAVVRPGSFGIVGRRTLLEVLGDAGGASSEAGNRIFVIPGGRREPVRIELRSLLQQANPQLNLEIRPGYVVYVPKAKKLRVYVQGQVERPGAVEVEEGETLSVLQAVAMAGGLARRASPGKTTIVRGNEDGTPEVIKVRLNRILAGKEPDAQLEDGDIVVVPKSFF